jgi:hypothetical protein
LFWRQERKREELVLATGEKGKELWTVAADLCRRMQPAKEADAAKVGREDMLKEAADQFDRG